VVAFEEGRGMACGGRKLADGRGTRVATGLRSPASGKRSEGIAATLRTGAPTPVAPVGQWSERPCRRCGGALGLCCGLGCQKCGGRRQGGGGGLQEPGPRETVTMDGGVPPQAIRARSPGSSSSRFWPCLLSSSTAWKIPPSKTRSLKRSQIGLGLPASQFPPGWLGSIQGGSTRATRS